MRKGLALCFVTRKIGRRQISWFVPSSGRFLRVAEPCSVVPNFTQGKKYISNSSSINNSSGMPTPGANEKRPIDAQPEESPSTADIMDDYEGAVQVAPNTFRDYGGVSRFSGRVETVKCFENNPLVRQRLMEEDGSDKVLVVDGGGSIRRALMGDMLGAGAVKMGWRGVIINGAIRDSAEIAQLPIGCKALGSIPLKSEKKVPGERGVPVEFAGLRFRPGQYVYADEDGIVVSDNRLVVPKKPAAL